MQHHSCRNQRAAKDKVSSSLTGALTRIDRKIVNLPSEARLFSRFHQADGRWAEADIRDVERAVGAEGHRRRKEQSGGVVPVFNAIGINFLSPSLVPLIRI
jgi:hypothetical protein